MFLYFCKFQHSYFNDISSFSINEIHDKNEYIWRYQRYELIREYFEKPLFAFPPLSLLAYIGWFISAVIFRGTSFRVFSEYHEQIEKAFLYCHGELAKTPVRVVEETRWN